MSKPAARSKPRYELFTVGRNKPSPARAASTKRASLRRSLIRTDASKLQLDFQGAEEPDAGADRLMTMPENDRAPSRGSLQTNGEDPTAQIKDAALPSLPDKSVLSPEANAFAPHPAGASRPRQQRSLNPEMTPRPPRPPQHSATMPPPSHPQQQSGFFRRLTSKFRSPPLPAGPPLRPARDGVTQRDSSRRKSMLWMPPIPTAPAPATQSNDFTNVEQRQAALRAMGLKPALPHRQFLDAEGNKMPLSEQEAEIDRRFTIVVPGRSSSEEDGESEAAKIREAWLVKQGEAGFIDIGMSLSDGDGDNAAAQPDAEGATSRKSDAVERASRDGTIGLRSPVRATFVDSPTLSPHAAEIGDSDVCGGLDVVSPIETAAEDFHTAPNTPVLPDDKLLPPDDSEFVRSSSPLSIGSPSTSPDAPSPGTKEQHGLPLPGSPSSPTMPAFTDKVSHWLRTSKELPAPPPASDSQEILTASPRTSLATCDDARASLSAPGTPRSRKEKPPPIIVTQDSKVQTHALALALSDSEASTSSEGRPSSDAHGRGRGRGYAPGPLPLAHAPSQRSRATVPALSPTRSLSPSAASSALPTPTTVSCAAREREREMSMERGSTSYSSDGHSNEGTGGARARRGTGTKAPMPGAIMEEYSETEPSSEGGEFGMVVDMNGTAGGQRSRPRPSQEAAVVGVAVPRPARAQTLEQTAAKQQNRKSFSLFGKKSLDTPREPRAASSMMNIRRAFTSATKARPKSTLEPSATDGLNAIAPGGIGRKRSKMFDASHLPASPTSLHPPGAGASDVGGNARQAVAPTIHSPGTIVNNMRFIEDEESRRLSELAFLT